MFSRYWRNFPWGFQVVQYLVLIFLFATLFLQAVAPTLVPALTGVETLADPKAAGTTAGLDALVWYQVFFTLGIFGVPAVVFAYLTHPRPAEYLRMAPTRRPLHWLLIAGLMIGAIPIFTGFEELVRKFDLGPTANKMYTEARAQTEKILDFRTPRRFAWILLVTALLPAVCEELMFRGVMMRFARQRSRSMAVPIVLTAVLFALVHFGNLYALPAILGAGLLLGLVFYWTGSLLNSMWAHLLFNGTQVIMAYFAANSPAFKSFFEAQKHSVPIMSIAAVLFGVCFYLLWKTRTPLPSGWHRDFTEVEAEALLRNGENRRQSS